MSAVEEMVCVMCCGCYTGGYSGDECDLVFTLCKYDLRNGDLFVLSWARGATCDVVKYLFRAANVWWRCAQYFVIAPRG